jgi:succinoglycan biosynthesis transport protein ExoP
MNTMEHLRSTPLPLRAGLGRGPETGEPAEMPIITRYLSIARRRKWVIVSAVVGAMLLGLLVTLLMTPKYTSFATLELQRETRNFTQVQGAQANEQAGAVDQEFYETQYGLLRAKSLSNAVVESLHLQDDPQFFALFGGKGSELFANGRPIGGNRTRAARISMASDMLLDHFDVAPERLSRLVRISFTSPNAEFSKKVVDAWSAQFVSTTLARRFEATAYARRFLEQRLSQLRARIEVAERQLVSYAAQQGIVNLPASTPAQGDGGLSGERSLAVDDLATLNRELARATADRVQAESRLNVTNDAATSESSALPRLRERRAEVAAEYARLMTQFEPDYPPAKAQQNQLAQLDRSIAAEEGRGRRSLRDAYDAGVKRESSLQAQVNTLKTGVLDTRRRSIQYNIYQRDADTNRQLYDALLQRYKEIGVAGGVGVNNISVVDQAEVAERPSSPRLMLNLFVSLFAGLIIGAGLALALEQVDEAIADPADVEKFLGTPLLGTTPRTDLAPVTALADRKSSLTEAYLSLRTTLGFATDHGVPKVFAVTSTRAGEGKSTTSYALARSLARQNRRTLLIDCDMRSPSVHHELGVENGKGLSNYLAGGIEDSQVLIFESDHDGMFAMTAGPQPPSAPELLSGEHFAALLEELRGRFDHVVLDAPPVMGLADAPLIASQVDATIFVIESHGTKKGTASVAINRLRAANATLVGVVLTKFDEKRAHYGYGYNYGNSGYGYGDTASDANV